MLFSNQQNNKFIYLKHPIKLSSLYWGFLIVLSVFIICGLDVLPNKFIGRNAVVMHSDLLATKTYE